MNKNAFTIGAATIAFALGFTGPAAAVDRERIDFANGSHNCQGALPNFEGSLRKRPLAVANEGTASAFVTCSWEGEGGTATIRSGIYFTNRTAGSRTISCTLVDGNSFPTVAPAYYPKSVVLAAGASGFITWEAGDIYSNQTNFSCNLPAGTDLNYSFHRYAEDVGA